jgi:hypothetical protein
MFESLLPGCNIVSKINQGMSLILILSPLKHRRRKPSSISYVWRNLARRDETSAPPTLLSCDATPEMIAKGDGEVPLYINVSFSQS